MQPGNNKESLLTSWKEIAAYLNCETRTCIRWEKNLKLPIHRMEGTPKSRVFAYKAELDDWLKARLNNGFEKEPVGNEKAGGFGSSTNDFL